MSKYIELNKVLDEGDEPTVSKMEQVEDEPQTMYYPQVDGITPSVIEPQTERSE